MAELLFISPQSTTSDVICVCIFFPMTKQHFNDFTISAPFFFSYTQVKKVAHAHRRKMPA